MVDVRLDSLKLEGFKSFPDEVEVTFPGETSAIVGPNGCGKSNLVDAMLWVLGEQSPSLLRLKSMGDVVFSGAAGRQAAGSAQVTLRLRCSDGRWAETDGRLEIRRRVYRSGPSEYRLNGRSARLRDVADELASVGLGTRSYAIIEQGRVGQVLSARPTDRRVLIEEAAGITLYKNRRRESELKLEHTRQNLLRLEDVISEVGRSLRQLKRQARQAERYQKMEQELKVKLLSLFTLEAHTLDQQRREIARRRAQIENEVAAAASGLGGAEADLAVERKAHDRVRGEVEHVRAEVSKLMTSRERLEAFLERSADLLDNLRASLDKARHDSAAIKARRHALEQQSNDAGERHEGFASALDDIQSRVDQAAEAQAGASQQLEEAENEAARRRKELLRTISTLTNSRNRLGDLEREQDRLVYTVNQLNQEQERLQGRRSEQALSHTEAEVESRAAATRAEQLEEQRRADVEERARLQEAASVARQETESLEHALWEHRHQLAGIERELARSTAARERLASFLPEERLAGQVSDYLHPDAGIAPVLDRVWSGWLELPVVRQESLSVEELTAVAKLEEQIRLAVATEAPPLPEPSLPEELEPLIKLAGIAPDDLPWLARVLPPAFRCHDPERARELADQLPNALILDGNGVLRQGRTMALPTAGTRLRGALSLRNERRQLQQQATETGKRAETSADRHRQLTEQVAGVEERLSQLAQELMSAEQERARTAAVEQSLSQELARLDRELASVSSELERNRKLKQQMQERHKQLVDEVSSLEQRSAEREQSVEEAASALDRQREAASQALRRLDRWRAELRLARERLTAAQAECDRLAEERIALESRLSEIEADVERYGRELAITEEEVVRSRTRLAEEQGELSSAREAERRSAESVEQANARVSKLENEVKGRRDQHQKARDTLHEIEVEQARSDGEWQRLSDAALSELATAPELLLENPAPEDESSEELELAIEDLRAGIERVGPVNLLALKEVEELQQRATFLNEQRQDLVDSLAKLDTTIREIDAICTERFLETFHKVNLVFAETFTHLFGGGAVRLDLVDEDDPLDSGIDITAQPPGKKNQSVQLLSGGEKALTALSLLISMFRISPSPFCILDEVDAPLDDANVERLADLIQEMTDHTQFIMITHNRRTMARADALYGVTMEEPGVSKIVSVRLEE
jgi:chromosome segregation protein